MPGPLLAVDAPSLLYRAWFALPDSIRDGEGRPVNALLGATNMVLAVVAEHEPRVVVMCRGPESARYRVEAFPDYHAARPEMPAGLASQWDEAAGFFEAFGWKWADDGELEADDVMHSYALVEDDADGEALILTGDRDMYQCASDRTLVLYVRTGKGVEEVDAAEVERRYGVPPALVPDFIALRGDPSDGIPGAKGVGEKTAAELLKRHGSLEGILEAAIGETRPKLRGALLGARDDLLAYKQIATLQDAGVKRPRDRGTDWAAAAAAARERGMNRLAERLEGAG
jgi:5'-3' exonuclease